MYTVISLEQTRLAPGTVVRMPGTWQDYQALCGSRGDGSIPRIKYREGEILLMSPMPKHGREANILADVVKVLLDSQDRNYEAFTPVTMELPEESGIEPDYCFYIDNWQVACGKDRIDWRSELPPDLVIEIDVTSYSDVNDYLPYQVPEVWLFKKSRLSIHGLEAGAYHERSNSRYFPEIGLAQLIATCLETATERGTGVAIRELRQMLPTP
ncbi:MAG: Uma2 family endonuclease [Elainella sp.]